MPLHRELSATRMFMRTLQPSWLSVLVAIPLAITLIGIHVISISLSTGGAFISLLDGDAAAGYTTYVVNPLLRLVKLNILGIGANVVVWGLIGWLLLSLAELVVKTLREWHEIENSTQIANSRIINHPMRQPYILRIVWRLGCIFGFVLLIIFCQPVLRKISALDQQMLNGQNLQQIVLNFIQAIFLWMLLMYAVIVLLRLYTFRTRLFGEILY